MVPDGDSSSLCAIPCLLTVSGGFSGTTQIINPCPGLLVDATAGGRSIASSTINEFYLNSHAAIQVGGDF